MKLNLILALLLIQSTFALNEEFASDDAPILDDVFEDLNKAILKAAGVDAGVLHNKIKPTEQEKQKALSNVKTATEEIFRHMIRTNVDHYRDPEWNFADEKIQEGHHLLMRLRHQLLSMMFVTEQPDYRACSELLGQMLHLLWSFYTNSNWVEIFPTQIYTNLGQQNRPLFPVAPPSIATCEKCRSTVKQQPCIQSLLVYNYLTSGYFAQERKYEGRSKEKPPNDKCTHGTQLYWSKTYRRQELVGNLTIQHFIYNLIDRGLGLHKTILNMRWNRLLGVEPLPEFVYVESKRSEKMYDIENALEKTAKVITKAETLQKACKSGIYSMTVLRISENALNDTIPETCIHYGIDVHIINVLSQSKASRSRRSYGNLDLYHLIASASGGTVYETTKGKIGEVVDIIKDSIVSSAPVSVMKFNWTHTVNNSVEIPVDDQILNLTIKVQSSKLTTIYLNKPNGSREDFMDNKVSLRKYLGSNLVIMKLFSPSPGLWRLKRGLPNQLDVEVTGISRLDFTYHFMQPGPGGFGQYPLVGRPIAGANTTVQVSIPLVDTVRSADRLVFLTGDGLVSATASLHNVGGRRGKTLFKSAIVIPATEFKVALEGQDKSGHKFRRQDPKLVSTLAIKLEVLPVSGPLYVNGSITIPFKVTNVGGGSSKIEIDIIDSQHLAQSPTKVIRTLTSGNSTSGTFKLNAGSSKKGQTTTMTISAKMYGASHNKVQYYVQRITVEEILTKAVDTIQPTCNVTSTSGTCDVGVDVCACVNNTWSMSVEFGDEGFGLQSVFTSEAGNKSSFTKDPFSLGHLKKNGSKHATLKTDCCHQKAKVNVVDMAGNVGICGVTINPKFTAPDPKLCIRKPSSDSGAKTPSLSCTTTSVSGSCDFLNETCADSCLNDDICTKYQWTYTAHVGNESFGTIQAVPYKVDTKTLLNVTGRDISLTTTCCHSSVNIKVIDLAGKVGQCTGSITAPNNAADVQSSAESSPRAGVIIGAVVGGAALVGGVTALIILVKKKIMLSAEVKPQLS